jgi:outer membrane receptor protein involved in Fe transport
MKQFTTPLLVATVLSSLAVSAQAQSSTLAGTVQTAAGEALPGANVFIKGTYQSTTTDREGRFTLPVSAKTALPFVLSVQFVGFETHSDTIRSLGQPLRVALKQGTNLMNEVVVSASRVEERALQAPVTVEKLNSKQVASLTAPDLITNLARLKGVDVTTSGLFMASISTRGFNGTTSERVLQLVDYMDTQSPSLNLNAGNALGLPEVDVASVEVLYGPSSALYGANAFNGVVLTTSKDPFKYEGLSVRLRGGNRDYVDGQLRYAQRLGTRWAFKIAGSFARAQDWIADNEAAQSLAYVPNNNPAGSGLGYDAVNRYGDVSTTFGATGGALNGQTVFMPGWSEREIIGPDSPAKLYRIIPSVHFLVTDKIKAMVEFKRAEGTTSYQATNRYRLKNFATNQYRIELRSDRWFMRAYQTQDFGADSYDLPFTGAFMQTAVDSRSTSGRSYAERYFGAYAQAYNTFLAQNAGNVTGAQAAARAAAAPIQLAAGTPEFNALREQVSTNPTLGVGSRINPSSFLTDLSGQYEFRPAFANIVVGGAYRQFRLGSDGHLFADLDGKRLRNDEYGGYGQVAKTLLQDHLKLTVAARLDGSQNFKAVFSPRASAVYSVGAQQQHNFRVSYNQAYRSPTQQGQYLFLDLGRALLLGNISNGFQGYSTAAATQLGRILTSANPSAALDAYAVSYDRLKPERVATIEGGYKGLLFEKLGIDVNYYYSEYNDFIGSVRLLGNRDGSRPTAAQIKDEAMSGQPFQNRASATRVLQVQANAAQKVRTTGGLVALTYAVAPALSLTGNYSLNILDTSNLPENFQTYYNTPKHKYNLGAAGQAWKGLNYSVNYRWAQGHLFESPFAAGRLESYSTFDAQLGYALPKLNSAVQVGASNLFNDRNIQLYGGPQVGRLLWAGLTLDVK